MRGRELFQRVGEFAGKETVALPAANGRQATVAGILQEVLRRVCERAQKAKSGGDVAVGPFGRQGRR